MLTEGQVYSWPNQSVCAPNFGVTVTKLYSKVGEVVKKNIAIECHS